MSRRHVALYLPSLGVVLVGWDCSSGAGAEPGVGPSALSRTLKQLPGRQFRDSFRTCPDACDSLPPLQRPLFFSHTSTHTLWNNSGMAVWDTIPVDADRVFSPGRRTAPPERLPLRCDDEHPCNWQSSATAIPYPAGVTTSRQHAASPTLHSVGTPDRLGLPVAYS